MTIIKTQVVAALAELRANRPRLAADRMIRGYLQRFGNGATNVNELDPALYEAVFLAVGGRLSTAQRFPVERAPQRPVRIRSPLTIQLEALLAARVGMPRSKPNYAVNVGNPGQFGDEDAPRQYSSDGVKVS